MIDIDYLSLQIDETSLADPIKVKTERCDKLYCHCRTQESKAYRYVEQCPQVTKTDEEGICIYCGYYAFKFVQSFHRKN